MALYQYTWGLTDIRKSEFEIRVEADEVDKSFLQVMPIADAKQSELTPRPIVAASNGDVEDYGKASETSELEGTTAASDNGEVVEDNLSESENSV